MSNVLTFKQKDKGWKILLFQLEKDPLKKAKCNQILRILKQKDRDLGDNPLTKQWLDLQNKIKDVKNLLKKEYL